MMKKEIQLQDCPIHKIQPWFFGPYDYLVGDGIYPWFLGPDPELPVLFNGAKITKDGMYNVLSLMLQQLFPDAMLFQCGYTVFCPECAKKNPNPEKRNKFGYGFQSQFSIASAKRNWNNACLRFIEHSIKNILNGKA